jgi:sialic acid synthase SpsE
MNTFELADRPIGPAYPPLVVAEIGINHGGSLEVAKGMVRAAALAGCEIVKHQTHVLEDEMTPEAKTIFPPNADKSIWDVMQDCALSLGDEESLKQYAESLGLIYLSTPFSRAAADFLHDIGVVGFKIGSGECNHVPLVRHIARMGKPVIMSTGMQTIDGLRPSVQALRDAGVGYALLECTNLYPSPPEIVSLQGIDELRTAFDDAVVGFSDHSIGPAMALAALGRGACIIERHFTDSRYRQGPDIACSMDPAELSYLVDRAKEIHTALRNAKHRSAPEDAVYRFARGSVVAERDLAAGHVLAEGDLWARRPGTGEISVQHMDALMGHTLAVPLRRNQQLRWADMVDVPPKAQD